MNWMYVDGKVYIQILSIHPSANTRQNDEQQQQEKGKNKVKQKENNEGKKRKIK